MNFNELKDAFIILQTEFEIVKEDVALLKSDRAKLLWSCAGLVGATLADYIVRAVT